MDRIVVAFANEEAQRRILRLLASDGWEPAACCASGAEAIRTVPTLRLSGPAGSWAVPSLSAASSSGT